MVNLVSITVLVNFDGAGAFTSAIEVQVCPLRTFNGQLYQWPEPSGCSRSYQVLIKRVVSGKRSGISSDSRKPSMRQEPFSRIRRYRTG